MPPYAKGKHARVSGVYVGTSESELSASCLHGSPFTCWAIFFRPEVNVLELPSMSLYIKITHIELDLGWGVKLREVAFFFT